PHFRVVAGGHPARVTDLRLRRPLALLGREPPATRRIRHRSISRVHCAVFWDGQNLWMVDLFSSNGTRLAGRKFDAGRLEPGQEFRLGTVRFTYLGGKMVEWEADSSTLEQPVRIFDDADRQISDSGLPATGQSAAPFPHEYMEREEQPASESVLDALRQQCARFERERDQFEQQLQRERQTNQECLAAVREELAMEVTALRQGSASTEQALERLSGEVASTREALFALYADVGAKVAEDTGAERTEKEWPQIAEVLRKAETRWTELARDLNGRICEIQRQIAESQEAHQALAGSMKLEREEMHKRLRRERRTNRKRLIAAGRGFAAKMASLGEQAGTVRQDLRPLQAAAAHTPTESDEKADGAETFLPSQAEPAKRQEEALLLAEARWKNLAEEFERRASELAQQVADCRQADAQMAENFKAALYETVRGVQLQQQIQSLEVAAAKDELSASAATLREQIASHDRQLQEQAAKASPLEQTQAALQPVLTRLESGEWAADLQKRWQSHLQSAIDQVDQRIAGIVRQSSLDRQAVSDRVALLEGTMTANLADLRSRLDTLREMAGRQQGPSAPSEPRAPNVRAPNVRAPEVGPSSPLPLSGQTMNAAIRLRQRTENPEDAESPVAPAWVINDEVTQRLLDFNTGRGQAAIRRRLLWALAAGLVAIVVSGGGAIQLWLKGSDPTKSSEAASLEQTRLSAR
ncbi:MAG TPA: FHA domain-containing protein, partial [Edaphobacter sp.]|nr:FHA domain-containing protein [Edaphobacter sp.]